MPEKRMIWKSVSTSRKVNKLSIKAALLWTWCIPYFDVAGYLEVEPDYLKYNILPRRGDITEKDIEDLVKEIISSGLWIRCNNSNGVAVVKDPKFFDMQKVREDREAPSRFSILDDDIQEPPSHYPWYGPKWNKIKKQIRDRDRVCKICGKTVEENKRELEIHHIKPYKEFNGNYELANNPNNLVALCKSCHIKIRYNPSLITQGALHEHSMSTPSKSKLNKVKESKEKVREYVTLSQDDFKKLQERYTPEQLEWCLNKLDAWQSAKDKPKIINGYGYFKRGSWLLEEMEKHIFHRQGPKYDDWTGKKKEEFTPEEIERNKEFFRGLAKTI